MALFKDIYEEYGKPVYRFLLSLSCNEDLAEELTQETFYQAFLYIDRFQNKCSIYTWLCQIGKNAWIKEYKRKGRYDADSIESLQIETNEISLENKVIQDEKIAIARKAIYQLEEPYREVFILKVFGELKLKYIARQFEKSESWARVTYYRARAKIMEDMDEDRL